MYRKHVCGYVQCTCGLPLASSASYRGKKRKNCIAWWWTEQACRRRAVKKWGAATLDSVERQRRHRSAASKRGVHLQVEVT